jgi:hypothetical protein
MSDVLPPVISSDHATSGEKKQKMNNQCTMLEDQDPHRGSFFKEYTLVIRKNRITPTTKPSFVVRSNRTKGNKPDPFLPFKTKTTHRFPGFFPKDTYIHTYKGVHNVQNISCPSNPIHAIEEDDPPKEKNTHLPNPARLEPPLPTPPFAPSSSQDRPSTSRSRQRHLCSDCPAKPSGHFQSRQARMRSGRRRGWLRGRSRRLRSRL